jgi:hypothetical protein
MQESGAGRHAVCQTLQKGTPNSEEIGRRKYAGLCQNFIFQHRFLSILLLLTKHLTRSLERHEHPVNNGSYGIRGVGLG